MSKDDGGSPQSRLRQMLNETIALEPIECILEKIQLQLITGLEELAPPFYDFTELDRIFGKFQKNKMSTKSEYAYLILDIVVYFIKTMKNVIIKREDYMRLEQETQDLEKKIREHLKIQNKVKIQFDTMDRTIAKLKEDNNKTREEVNRLNHTVANLQKKLHQQLNFFTSKINSMSISPSPNLNPKHPNPYTKHPNPNNKLSYPHQYTQNTKMNETQQSLIKDFGEKPQRKEQKQEWNPYRYPYHTEFSSLLQDIRRLTNPEQREYNKDRHRSLQ